MTYRIRDYGYGLLVVCSDGREIAWLQGDGYAELLDQLDRTHDGYTDSNLLSEYDEGQDLRLHN